MTMMILTLLAVLLCAVMFILLLQYLFPRRAPWWLALAALVSGIGATFVLLFAWARLAQPTTDLSQYR